MLKQSQSLYYGILRISTQYVEGRWPHVNEVRVTVTATNFASIFGVGRVFLRQLIRQVLDNARLVAYSANGAPDRAIS